MVNISKLNKAAVLAALYNHSKLDNTDYRHRFDPDHKMTVDEAQKILDSTNMTYFSSIKGRIMRVDLSRDEINTQIYDLHNGPGAAEDAILEELTKP